MSPLEWCFLSMNLDNQIYSIRWKWGRKHHEMTRKSKHNLIGGNATHFGSEGLY